MILITNKSIFTSFESVTQMDEIIMLYLHNNINNNNKLDIIIRDNEKGTCMFIDFAISGDINVTEKEADKF